MSPVGDGSASRSRSRSRSRSVVPVRHVAVRVGEESGFPLVRCPQCGLDWVVELRVKKDNVNNGRVFFKCPRNLEWESSMKCSYYKWQRLYLQELCALDIVEIHADRIEPALVLGWQSEDESGGCLALVLGWQPEEAESGAEQEQLRVGDDKVDRLVTAVKWLAICVCGVLVALVWVGMAKK
ncbi:unnamed protein product [Urochloa humidicola]